MEFSRKSYSYKQFQFYRWLQFVCACWTFWCPSQYVNDFLSLVMLGSLMRGLPFEAGWGGGALWIRRGQEVSSAFRFDSLKKKSCLSRGVVPRQGRLRLGGCVTVPGRGPSVRCEVLPCLGTEWSTRNSGSESQNERTPLAENGPLVS